MLTIDIHIHVFGDSNTENGCIMSGKLEFACRVGSRTGFLADTPFSLNDDAVAQTIIDEISNSVFVDKGVLLALDKPHDQEGNPMQPELYASNQWVAEVCMNNPDKALFGASIHPYRTDALDELDRVKGQGAVLIKWIPSSQNIQPNHIKCKSFYRRMAKLGLPLLCHVGDEHSIADVEGNKSLAAYNHPELLIPALEEGVTVIMAHCCLPIFRKDNDFSEAFVRMMEKADDKGWRLYADISALVGGWKRSFMAKQMALRLPEKRLVMGSDWPNIPNLSADFCVESNEAEFRRIKRLSNVLDRNVEYLKFLGFSTATMQNATAIFQKAQEPVQQGNPEYVTGIFIP